MVLKSCKIEYHTDYKGLIALEVGKEGGIGIQNAEEIVSQFKGNELILAKISKRPGVYTGNDVLYVEAKFPKVTVDCHTYGEAPRPLRYTLTTEQGV